MAKLGDLYTIQGELNSDGEVRSALGVGAPATLSQQGFNLNLVANELNLDSWIDFFGRQYKTNVPAKADRAGAIGLCPVETKPCSHADWSGAGLARCGGRWPSTRRPC